VSELVNLTHTPKDPSGTQQSEGKTISRGSNTINIIKLKCQPQVC